MNVTCNIVALIVGVLCAVLPTTKGWAQILPKHATTPTHLTLMEHAVLKAAELPTPLTFSDMQVNRMSEGAQDEDMPPRWLNHGFNPLSGGMFPGGSKTAAEAGAEHWMKMVAAFAAGDLDGGDGAGAWHYLGRVSHLAQDMTSPLHTLAQWHDGVINPTCQFEEFWQNRDPALRAILAAVGCPLDSRTLPPEAAEQLDVFTAQRLAYRFATSVTQGDSDVRPWFEALAWITYFRTTFWGEIAFGSSGNSGSASDSTTAETVYSDGTVGVKPNALHTMFDGNIRWVAGFADNYYEITDRQGSVFRFMKWSDIDDWAACGASPSHAGWAYGGQDSYIRSGGTDEDARNVRITGRFWFDTRELGKSATGSLNRFCYPARCPDGTVTSDHLHEYYGRVLYPLTVRYNAGLLGLANRRVIVNTDAFGAEPFLWGRRDNSGLGPAFTASAVGRSFYFVAGTGVSLIAPPSDVVGRVFVSWLRDGSVFTGVGQRAITINDSGAPIPAAGITYTAQYEDKTPPTVTITVPATAGSYETDRENVSVRGIAADNLRVKAVTWSNNRGGSGIAYGTTNWEIPSVPLEMGSNEISVAASDDSGNLGFARIFVTRVSLSWIAIFSPTSESTYTTTHCTVTLTGRATENRGVEWFNSRGGGGVAQGTTQWSVPNVLLQPGHNNISVTALLLYGNTVTDSLTVNYVPLLQFASITASDNKIRLQLTGPPGATCVLQSSFNLIAWNAVQTNDMAACGCLVVNKAIDGLCGPHFFRAVLRP